MWYQKEILISAKSRGFHLITDEVLESIPELVNVQIGLLHVFIQHTSAALTINENADPTVREDFEQVFNRLVPEGEPYYQHIYEGDDDLPSHIKSSLLGPGCMIPVAHGQLTLGVWQGIYLCEFRDAGGARRLTVTLNGE
ncbi:MAG: hypothetical protein CENE_01505 [Candidatus Celerinatantimonas neptuna]|nr:MAG: hypothetical protein CENE_01505 [Candidatus Celerinatantimonas neptuna]